MIRSCKNNKKGDTKVYPHVKYAHERDGQFFYWHKKKYVRDYLSINFTIWFTHFVVPNCKERNHSLSNTTTSTTTITTYGSSEQANAVSDT